MTSRGVARGLFVVFTGLTVGLLFADNRMALSIQFLLGKLAYSTSNGAALFLVGYGALAFWCMRSIRSAHIVWFSLFLFALFAGHSLNLWITLRYLNEMAIPAGAHAYHWANDHYSFTSLFHSHLGKTAFAILTRSVGWSPSSYDNGDVFLAWVPEWAAWSVAVTFLVALASSLLALRSLPRSTPIAHLSLFVIAAAIAIRGMIDGGPLAAAMPPSFTAIGWIAVRIYRPQTFHRALMLLTSIYLTSYLTLWITVSSDIPAMGGFLFPACVFLLLGTNERRAATGVRLAHICIFGVLAISLMWDAEENLFPLIIAQAPGCEAISIAGAKPAANCEADSAFDTYLKLGENPRKPKAILISNSRDSGPSTISGNILMIEANRAKLTFSLEPTWQRISFGPAPNPDGWLAFNATTRPHLPPVFTQGMPNVTGRNNFNVYLWELSRTFSKSGVSEFILMLETQGNHRLWERTE